MPQAQFLTHNDRRYRSEKIVDAYLAGGSSRQLAERFNLSDGRVREIVRHAGVARSVGRPSTAPRAGINSLTSAA